MKKLITAIILMIICFTGCAKDEKWHPESTEVVFDSQQIVVEKADETTDIAGDDTDWYRVTATAESETSPFYNLTMTALIGIKYYPGQYPNIRDEKYSGYAVECIKDVSFCGGGENIQWMPFSRQVYTSTGTINDSDKDIAVLWGHGRYQAEHDKKTKNISDFLPGMFFKYDTTVKEYFRTERVSMFIKLYPEEIVSCTPQPYHLQIECTDSGATFG
ncbi:MAG: hypothetical protein IJ410_07670 [Oscillospiraceae bacterium]|nr:hypothetical protein [Oscillospiraceae bacterium]